MIVPRISKRFRVSICLLGFVAPWRWQGYKYSHGRTTLRSDSSPRLIGVLTVLLSCFAKPKLERKPRKSAASRARAKSSR